ncbi:hypothetical protein GSI_07406 [Ganoderma sinense ZZ0214-1]|uniref:Uncharacterized protein n=1 Tax=Ganoderma sinense ZZ0214-1 TaxID=1077348 RepID=A0A2G8S8Y2_9APHY|nr:hypothetical protein GSI_07406 [Ganoderma sinense ZZ0214-1]
MVRIRSVQTRLLRWAGDTLPDLTPNYYHHHHPLAALALALSGSAVVLVPDPRPPPDPMAGPEPAIIPFMMNIHPFYETVRLRSDDPDSVTVKAILGWASRWIGWDDGSLSLRWITDEGAAFVPKDDSDLDLHGIVGSGRLEAAKAWYSDKGHSLASEPIDTDHSLRKRLRSARTASGSGTSAGEPEIRLYVVVPAVSKYLGAKDGGVVERERETYSLDHSRSQRMDDHLWGPSCDLEKDDSIPTRMAALYHPAFAYAQKALRGLQDGLPPEHRDREPGENASGVTGSVGAPVAPIDGGKDDGVLEGRRFIAQLRDALHGLSVVEVGHSGLDSKSKEAASAHAAALGKVLQELFDDHTLKVEVTPRGGGIEVEVEAACPTPYRIPACYIVGKDKLVSARGSDSRSGRAPNVPESMVAYRDAMLDDKHVSIFAATCCPCLVIGTLGSTVQIYAAFFADWVYRTHLCDFALDATDPNVDEKVRIIRNTARMLREAYARLHVGVSLGPPKHALLPWPAILMPAPLPVHLYLLDRVLLGQSNDLFTGKLKLPGPLNNNDGGDGDRSKESSRPEVRELPVHVKFTDNYGVAAHRLLAAHTDASGAPRPLAPQLYWAGEVVPGLWMVVMETLARWDADMPEDGVDCSENFALPKSPRVLGGPGVCAREEESKKAVDYRGLMVSIGE